jgi:hypothetical protein
MHVKLPVARAGHAISFVSRGHHAIPHLQYTATHTDPDHNFLTVYDLRLYCRGAWATAMERGSGMRIH